LITKGKLRFIFEHKGKLKFIFEHKGKVKVYIRAQRQS